MVNADAAGQLSDHPTGSVLVLGAGIGGMQASLDLAEAGFKVYLLDKSPAIGGTMAQLDKTFPTNDCAMCILSPKLVECGRHLNIKVMTYAELEDVEGEAGNFTAHVRQRARYVNVDECTGCGDCAEVCPIVRPDAFNVDLSERRAAYKLYPQAIPNAFVIEKAGRAPCRDACPIHQRAQGYVALIREGRFADAYRTIREDNPFPSICGRVCNHKCEDECSRGKVDEPVSIMRLKRFVADWALDHPEEIAEVMTKTAVEADAEAQVAFSGQRVAIVGGGPAGLTCAQDLVKLGHAVTVFEALPVAGGMMRVGIPAYRMPYDLVQQEIDQIVDLGVELKLKHRVDDAAALLAGDANGGEPYDAVFVAVGAHEGVLIPIPGVDLPEVTVATDFLRQVALEDQPTENVEGKRVLVLGGGNVAVDAAMTAVRLGAEWVGMTCLESRETMPAHEWEIQDAVEEGIELFPSRTFKEVEATDGHVRGLRCVEIDFRGFVDGRPDFDEIPGTETIIEADVVIFAIGQRPDVACLPDEAKIRGRWAAADDVTLATGVPGLFAGGDVMTGTRFVVDAIAAGHRAARSIDAYLRGEDLPEPEPELEVAELTEEEARSKVARGEAAAEARHEVAKLPVEERLQPAGDGRRFREVYPTFTVEEAQAEAARCLTCGICSECLQCVYACQKLCIDHDMQDEVIDLNIGAVVLVPGLETVPGDIRPEFGYGRVDNVVTSIEFERMLSASGPWGGVVQRPSDGRHPHRIAFIQCVGSRDLACDQGYCSAVCCMYATKEALIAQEHDPNVEASIFYMDVRSFGKGFERYINRAKDEYGVRFVRSMVSTVTEVPGTGDVRVRYATDDGKNVEEVFDMLVLSVGLCPPAGTRELAERLGVQLNAYGFAEPAAYRPGQTTRPGIFVAGAFSEPKDIPETVIEASCVAAQASALLASARHTMTVEPEWPEERDVSDEWPRVGVFVCHCGINIGSVVDVPEVVEYVAGLRDVAYVERNLYTCSQDTQERIREQIIEHDLNRVVVASCTPRTHEPLFQETLRAAGLNPHLFQMTNIREQDSWVHRNDPQRATDKAKDLVRMAVAKARRLHAIDRSTFEVSHEALVIGGGLGGMTAALSIAEQGFRVTLIEREAELGGNLQHIYTPLPDGADPQVLLQQTIESVRDNPRISVRTEAEVTDIGGYLGQYSTMLRLADGSQEEIHHGVIVVATGAQEITPREYRYSEDERVVTQRELEQMLTQPTDLPIHQSSNIPISQSTDKPTSVVMIQCVGSRDDEHPYCSRICCTEAIKNALTIKERSPETDVYVLYRDIRTFGFKERYYREARRSGVVFLQYDADEKPEVRSGEDGLAVDVVVQPEGERFTLDAGLVVLSAGIEPNADNEPLAQLLKVPLNEDRFFLEAHVKLRPLEFAADGVYLCGLAHSPRFLDETIAQAQGAAVQAVRLLARDELEATSIVATVDPELCAACGSCVEVCPYGARILEPGMHYAEVIDVLCQGCGACIVSCPNKACYQKGFEPIQMYEMLDEVMA
ncbi:MAG TPA: FAD-dependent oxidoreductase [Chloroflexi bacterium]|nr:FAD-dependent oxidoreductase [Chloroflexota bacterium]